MSAAPEMSAEERQARAAVAVLLTQEAIRRRRDYDRPINRIGRGLLRFGRSVWTGGWE